MVVLLIIVIVLVLAVLVKHYRSKAEENYHLFELSKGYYQYEGSIEINPEPQVKLNKDGSIAKKRGRKSNVKTT